MRIRHRLLIAFALILLPLFLLEVYDLAREYRERRADILRGHRDTAEAVAAGVEVLVRDLVDRARSVAQAAVASGRPEAEIRGRFAGLRQWGPYIVTMGWAAADGRILYTDPPELFRPGVGIADRPYFRAVAGGGEWAISDLIQSRLEDRPVFIVAAAARSGDRSLRGVVAVGVRPEIFERILGRVGGSGPGATVAIVDRSGRALFVGGRPDIRWEQRDWSQTPSIQRALRGEAVVTEEVRSVTDGRLRLGARVPIRSVGWVASVTTPVAEAMAPVRRAAWGRVGLLAGITVLSLLAAVLLGHGFSGPVEALRGEVRALAGGDLSRRVMPHGRDEVADLGRAFNDMATRLDESWQAAQAQGQEAAAKAARLEALTDLSRLLMSTLDPERVFEFVVTSASRLLEARVGILLVVDRETGELVVQASAGVRRPDLRVRSEFRLGEGLPGIVAATREAIAVPDVLEDPRFVNVGWARAEGLHGFAGAPLVAADRCVGVLCVMRQSTAPWKPPDLELLAAFCAQAAVAIENARLYAEAAARAGELDRRSQALEALNETARLISSERDFLPLLQKIADSARRLARSRYAALGVLGEGGRLARFIQSGLPEDEARRIGDLPTGRGILGVMLREGRPLRLADLGADPRSSGFPPNHPPMRSFMGVPIRFEGRILGSLYLTEKLGGGSFTDQDEALLMAFAAHAAITLEQARLVEQTREDAATKATLLRELHHRVRNNLASIIGLLSMELTRPGSRSAEEAIQACIDRVHGIAEVHDLLATGEFGSVDLNRVLETIARSCFHQGAPDVQIVVEGPRLRLPSRHLTALALIANEVLINASKHAFPGRDRGQIAIRTALDRERVTLEIRDDGVGLAPGGAGDGSGLGLEIVQALARADLGGEFRLYSDGGTVAVVTFPKPQRTAVQTEGGA